MSDERARIRVGPAGWDYPDWRGIVYPNTRKTKTFDELAYLARFFDTVEINSTFYRPGDPKAAAGRRGAVLLQVPWAFKRDDASEEWLRDVLAAFSAFPLVLEVRHASWNSADVLARLTEQGVGIVNVDQPLFDHSIAPAAHTTGAVAYVRMHGRNYLDWFRKSADRNQRYDYLYTADELRPWVARSEEMAARPTPRELNAVTNNHHLRKAPTHAGIIEPMLAHQKVRLPPTLIARYRAELEPFAVPDPGDDGALFAGRKSGTK